MKSHMFTALATLMSLSTSAHANSVSFDLAYETVGPWKIAGSSMWGDSCIADINNNATTLRVMYTVYTNSWYFGVPYYQNNNPTAQFGLGWPNVATQPIRMDTQVLDGWAMYDFSEQLQTIHAAKDGWYLNINLDRGLQSWQLHSKTAIMAKVKQCAQNHGKKNALKFDSKKIAAAIAAQKKQQATQGQPQIKLDPKKFAAGLKKAQQQKQQQAKQAKPQFNFFDKNGCPLPNIFKSPASNQPINVEFRDWTHQQQAKRIYWIGFDGQLVQMPQFVKGNARFRAYNGHNFVVKDIQGKCYGGLHKATVNNFIFNIK